MRFSYLNSVIYSPLVWMFHSRSKNNKIIRFHERRLQIIYSDKESTFIELLKRIILYQFMNETYVFLKMLKFKRCLAPALIKEIIPQNRQNRYELSNNVDFLLPLLKVSLQRHRELELLSSKNL